MFDRFSLPAMPDVMGAARAVGDAMVWRFGLQPVPSFCDPVPGSAAAVATIAGWESTVGKSGLIWDHFFSNADQDWSDEIDLAGLARFLRLIHPDKTAMNVAADTRQPVDTVKKWLAGVAVPNGRAMLVLVCVYGPEVLVAMLRKHPGWLVETARAAEQAHLEARVASLRAKRGRAAA